MTSYHSRIGVENKDVEKVTAVVIISIQVSKSRINVKDEIFFVKSKDLKKKGFWRLAVSVLIHELFDEIAKLEIYSRTNNIDSFKEGIIAQERML